MSKTIEFWFEFGSNYSYLSVMRIEELAKANGVSIVWKPFLLGPIFKSFGWDTSPFVLQKEKGAYMWQDMERQCRKYGLRWTKPTTFPRMAVLPMRIAILGSDEPWIGGFSRRVMTMNFAEDVDINSADSMTQVLTSLGLDAADVINKAQSDDNKLRLRHQTEDAKALGIFGAPAFMVGDQMYWGNDRLDDAIQDASRAHD